jgi:hypothetical protein
MSSEKTSSNIENKELNVIHYMGILICSGLSLIGLYQLFTSRIEDGIINIIIGTSLVFTFIPFDYNKAANWQKSLVVIYGLALMAGIVYVLYLGFSR